MKSNGVWLHISYQSNYGMIVGHHMAAKEAEDVNELIRRYEINPDQVLSFTVDGNECDLRKVLAS